MDVHLKEKVDKYEKIKVEPTSLRSDLEGTRRQLFQYQKVEKNTEVS